MKNQQDLVTIIACSHVNSYGILLLNSTSSCPTNLSNCKVPSAQTKTTQQVGSKIMSSFMLAMFRILPLCFQQKEKLALSYQSYNTPLLMMQINTMKQKKQLLHIYIVSCCGVHLSITHVFLPNWHFRSQFDHEVILSSTRHILLLSGRRYACPFFLVKYQVQFDCKTRTCTRKKPQICDPKKLVGVN